MEKKKNKALDMNTPLLSLTALLDLFEVKESERTHAIGLVLTIASKENLPGESLELIRVYKDIIKTLSDEGAKRTQAALDKIAAARKDFLQDQQRVFYSLGDAVNDMIENRSVPAKLVKALLGGQWPKHPFGFECISAYMMAEDGTLAPDDGTGIEAPGPDFQLQFKMIHDPVHPKGSAGDR